MSPPSSSCPSRHPLRFRARTGATRTAGGPSRQLSVRAASSRVPKAVWALRPPRGPHWSWAPAGCLMSWKPPGKGRGQTGWVEAERPDGGRGLAGLQGHSGLRRGTLHSDPGCNQSAAICREMFAQQITRVSRTQEATAPTCWNRLLSGPAPSPALAPSLGQPSQLPVLSVGVG